MALSRFHALRGHERDLIARSVSGDMRAADALLVHYRGDISRIIHRMVDDAEAVQDILAEVLTEVYRSLGKFGRRSSFRTWLYRITVNVTLEHIRRAAPPGVAVPVDDLADPDADVAEAAVRNVQAERIEREIGALSDTYRMPVFLYYVAGCSCGEIAEILSVPKGTIQRRIFEGTRQIRHRLRERGQP